MDPAKVATLHSGVNLQKVEALRPDQDLRHSLGLEQATPLIVTVGHIRKIKGVDVLLRSAAVVCREFPHAVFLVVGDISEPEHYLELEALKTQLHLGEQVKFVGALEDVLPLLKSCDVFCLPSRSEGFSNALLEAMACRLPCVTTCVGGNAEAIEDGVNGFVVQPEDSGMLAERILLLLRHPGLAAKMAESARKTVEERFDINVMIASLADVYDRLRAASSC
jgi:glycosyltransferase involved in cell wall biosynthesis